ncbi:hypothetical protein [Zoogloea sp.]|uniref:hypothetical protein n=1 Tax=Zoogloea sp. TaxID=49181 RepID=UPI0035B13679
MIANVTFEKTIYHGPQDSRSDPLWIHVFAASPEEDGAPEQMPPSPAWMQTGDGELASGLNWKPCLRARSFRWRVWFPFTGRWLPIWREQKLFSPDW